MLNEYEKNKYQGNLEEIKDKLTELERTNEDLKERIEENKNNLEYHKHTGDTGSRVRLKDIDGVKDIIKGTWTSKTFGTTYQASSAGFVCTQGSTDIYQGWIMLKGYTDSSTPPTTLIVSDSGYNHDVIAERVGFTMPVKKGDYWKVDRTSSGSITSSLKWIPFK